MPDPSLQISCLCGAATQNVQLKPGIASLRLCHCETCRRATGQLFTSYFPILRPEEGAAAGLSHLAPPLPGGWTRAFCPTCGCHVFRYRDRDSQDDGGGVSTQQQQEDWEVATGTIIDTTLTPTQWPHISALESPGRVTQEITKDGGASIWLRSLPEAPTSPPASSRAPTIEEQQQQQPHSSFCFTVSRSPAPKNTLPARCACGNIGFHVRRPTEPDSYLPSRPYPDLMYAYCSTDPALLKNPEDQKWWIVDDHDEEEEEEEKKKKKEKRFLAGTCACRSCRLASGFEAQSWAFVPKCDIFLWWGGWGHDDKERSEGGGKKSVEAAGVTTLDFGSQVAREMLTSYRSSPGVVREFCKGCGATVFWHAEGNEGGEDDVVDVSVGLFCADDGAVRAEEWLSWWMGRVSFAEEAGRAREDAVKIGTELVGALEKGMWGDG